MSIIPQQNLVGYWPLDGHALDMADNYDTIAYGNSADLGFAFATSLTTSFTTAGNNRILFVSGWGNVNVDNWTGVTYGGVAMTLVDKGLADSSSRYNYLYVLVNPPTGANNVVISASDSGGIQAAATYYTGAEQVAQPNVYAKQTATSNSSTQSITTTKDNCWTIMVISNQGHVVTAGTGDTKRLQVATGGHIVLDSNSAKTPPGAVSFTWTQTSSVYYHQIMCSFSPAKIKYKNNGTVTGALPVPSQNPAIPTSLAYKFNGSSDYITIPDNSSLNFASGAFTISMWIKTNSTFAADGWILDKKTAGGDIAYSISCENGGTLFCRAGTAYIGDSNPGTYCDTKYDSVTKINNNIWWHVVFIYDGARLLIYKQGKLTTVKAASGLDSSAASALLFGKRVDGLYSNVNLQEVAIFNKALSAQEIQAIYNQSKRKYTSKGWLSGVITAIRTSDFFQFFFN